LDEACVEVLEKNWYIDRKYVEVMDATPPCYMKLYSWDNCKKNWSPIKISKMSLHTLKFYECTWILSLNIGRGSCIIIIICAEALKEVEVMNAAPPCNVL
jgi:hypothetical protein